jgi:hypothetical protein
VKGWRLATLLAARDKVLLIRNYWGQARIDRIEKKTNSLAPLQPAGEIADGTLLS